MKTVYTGCTRWTYASQEENQCISLPGFALDALIGGPSKELQGWRERLLQGRAAMGGPRWRGVLVRTGVYEDGDVTCGAHAVVDRVSDAVAHILEVEAREKGEVV